MMDDDYLNILLVDDDEDDQILTRELLLEARGSRFHFQGVATYDAGLEAMKQGQHDVYLIDYHLGKQTGLELVRTAIAYGCKAPMIMLTGQEDRETDLACMEAGAVDYLVKSHLSSELLERSIRYAMERMRTEQEKEKLQDKLLQSQKMEAIAGLAGGIAHEFNNALHGILGNIEMVETDRPDISSGIGDFLEVMKASAERMANLTVQLLAYAQGGKYRPQKIPIDDFVTHTLPLIQHRIEPEIQFETQLSADESHIEADLTQMQTVLSALVINAAEANEGKGLIRVAAKQVDVRNDDPREHLDLELGSYVCLSVEDNGRGMDRETKSRIFEPFFTTKALGRGLGLAAAHGIIENHGGIITVKSEVGKGTLVCIYLPTVKVEMEKTKEPDTAPQQGARNILVIEDEEQAMNLSRRILERLGYGFVGAKTGREAIDVVRDLSGEIDLAMLDIGLPDMPGYEVYRRIKEIKPDARVVVCSGYAIDGPVQEIMDEGAQGFIQKPYTISELSAKLSQVLVGG